MRRFATPQLATAAAVLGLLTGCGAHPAAEAADTGKIADAVKTDIAALVTAFNAHDADKSVAFDAPDYVGMMHGLPNVAGPQGDLALTKQQLADPAAKFEVSDENVSVAAAGDRAMFQSTYSYTFTDPATKKPKIEQGNWLVGFRKQPDGSYKIKWSVVSDTGTAPVADSSPHA